MHKERERTEQFNEMAIIMDMKNYFDLELRSTFVHAIIGTIIGYVSFTINQPLLNLLLAIVVLAATIFIIRLVWKVQKNFRWWLGNGIVVFLFIWLAVWTIFYNLNLWNLL